MWIAAASVVVLVVLLVWAALVLLCSTTRVALRRTPAPTTQRLRVAVIGGGIAGTSAAWALKRSGVDVVIYERAATLGGNAKTHDWPAPGGVPIRTGLSVLAWPGALFRNYTALLATLGPVDTTEVALPFLVEVRGRGHDNFVALSHTHTPTVNLRFVADLARWKRLVSFVRRVGSLFGVSNESLYSMALANPLNVLPLRWLATLFGVSASFWQLCVVPIYSSTFLSTNLNWIPSVIAPVMDEIIPLDSCPKLTTWTRDSSHVFQRLAEGIDVRLNVDVQRVSHGAPGKCTVTLANGSHDYFDRVVFACPADVAQALLARDAAGWLLSTLLRCVSYVDDDWGRGFVTGIIHSDVAAVLDTPEAARCVDSHSNYVAVDTSGNDVSNTFILSSWVPAWRAAGTHGSAALVTYGSAAAKVPAGKAVQFQRAHPHLCLRNLVIATVLRWWQGRNGIHFCGSWTTPGNGHDLSLCSGLAVAHAIGAAYPFADNAACAADFERARTLLGL